MLPPSRVTVGKIVGLHASWFVYRGAGAVDVRSAADRVVGRHAHRRQLAVGAAVDAAGMPADGKVSVRATFSEPGEYVIRVRADDGALTSDGMVTVTVTK